MTDYIGVLDGEDPVWGVRIPDLPGCHGGGSPADAALADAIGAAREWAEHRGGAGGGLPKPRSLTEISAAEAIDAWAGDIAVIVPVLLDRGARCHH